MTADLQAHIQTQLPHARGSWIQARSAYESGLSRAFGFQDDPGKRYWDGRWGGYKLEYKKGTSIWLDLVRYSEVLLGCDVCD